MNFVKSFNMFGTDAMQIPCIAGTGVPTTSTNGAVGMLYMDTSSSDGELWKCTGVDSDVYTWVKLIDEDLLNLNIDIDWNRVHKNLTLGYPCNGGRVGISINESNATGFLYDYGNKVGNDVGTVKIVLDGKEYISKITSDGNWNTYVGNGHLIDDTYADTGEDICLLSCCVNHMTLFLADSIQTPSTVEIYTGEGELQKIDNKFLPKYRLIRNDDGLLYITIDGSPVGNGIEVSGLDALYTEQKLTEDQKAQARANIGLSDTDIQNKVQAYVNEAILGGAW